MKNSLRLLQEANEWIAGMDEQSAGHIQLIKSGAYSLMVCHFHSSINGCLRCNKMAHRTQEKTFKNNFEGKFF